jgi:hypothetical protein
MSGDSNLVIIVKAEAAGSAALRVVHEQCLIKLRDWGRSEHGGGGRGSIPRLRSNKSRRLPPCHMSLSLSRTSALANQKRKRRLSLVREMRDGAARGGGAAQCVREARGVSA